MGGGRIETLASVTMGLTSLQQHYFGQDWHWELIIVRDLSNLMEHIQASNGYAVSNGSFQAGKGTAAWIIEDSTNENYWIVFQSEQ